MPFESIKEVAPDKYRQIMAMQSTLTKYTYFTQAQNLGIVFGPEDISLNDLVLFSAIRTKIDEVMKHGK